MTTHGSFSFLTAIKDGFDDFAKTYPTVLGQTEREFEWIIVDDASLERLAAKFPALAMDPRVKIIRNDEGKGQTVSLNLGIRAAKGTWVLRMDGDDLCAPERLAMVKASVARHPAAQLLFSDYKVIDGEDRQWAEVKMRTPLSNSFFEYLKHQNNPICHPTVAFRRTKPDGSLRFYREDLVNAQDYALWKEILAENGSSAFVHLPCPSLSYRIVRNSLSGARAKEQEVEKKAIREGLTLKKGEQSRPSLSDPQKDAMQNYRLLYYRFAGHATPAGTGQDLALLKGTLAMKSLFARALFYVVFRPFRKLLLRHMFAGIYE